MEINKGLKKRILKIEDKYLAGKISSLIFAVLKTYAALVKGLRRLPFTEESRVRIPYVVQKGFGAVQGLFCCHTL